MSSACMPSFSFIPFMVSGKKILKHFLRKLTLLPPRQPIEFIDLDKSRMKRRGLLNKHFCKRIPNIPNETEKIVNVLFSHYKSMGTISCHSNQSSYPIGIQNTTFRSPYLLMLYVKYEKNWPHSFRGAVVWKCWQTTDGRTDDGYLHIL